MNILLCFNNKFAALARTLIISLMCHHEQLHFYIGYMDLDKRHRDGLQGLVENYSPRNPWDSGIYAKKSPQRTIKFIEFDVARIPDQPMAPQWSKDTWTRCFIWDQIEADRLLYLDADIIVNGNIEPFYYDDLHGLPIKAAPDTVSKSSMKSIAALGLGLNSNPELPYFNAGVILFDLAAMRRQGITVQNMQAFAQRCPTLPFNDQDFLNLYFKDQYKPADPYIYNCFTVWPSRYSAVADPFYRDRYLPRWERVTFCQSAYKTAGEAAGTTDETKQKGCTFAKDRAVILHYSQPLKPNSGKYKYGFADEYWYYASMDPKCPPAKYIRLQQRIRRYTSTFFRRMRNSALIALTELLLNQLDFPYLPADEP
ncbi:hypothetical protein IJT17_02590 [bacterium]|nr:hypothetical protein [bacterium]